MNRFGRPFRTLILVGALLAAFATGLYIGRFQTFPFLIFSDVYRYVTHRVRDVLGKHSLKQIVTNARPADLVTIKSLPEVAARRDSLNRFLWRGRSRHDFTISESRTDVPPLFRDCATDARDLLVNMPFGFTSAIRFLRSRVPNSRLAIYHRGHNAEDPSDISNVRLLCRSGFDVMLLDLPMLGDNSRPVVEIENIGSVVFTIHDQLKYLESDTFNPLILFLAPLVRAVDFATAHRDYKTIVAVGISGGAAVLTLFAAADDRVGRTYAVAGVAPAFLRFAEPSTHWGDYEQTHQGLARLISDLDLYVLAAAGKTREYVQVFNQFDPCCFPGALHRTYTDEVSARVRELGQGHFEPWLDTQNLRHSISRPVLLRIIESILTEGTSTSRPSDAGN